MVILFNSANYFSFPPFLPFSEDSKPLAILVGKILAVTGEQNQWKHHVFLLRLKIPIFLVFLRSSCTLTHWSTYNLLISFLSLQFMPFPLWICVTLVQFTRANSFCQSVKKAYNFSSMSKVLSDTMFSIPIASLFPFPLLHPNWYSPNKSPIFPSVLLLCILATIFAERSTKLFCDSCSI